MWTHAAMNVRHACTGKGVHNFSRYLAGPGVFNHIDVDKIQVHAGRPCNIKDYALRMSWE